MINFKQNPHLSGANIYAVNMRQYSDEGSFNAFLLHLPRLKDMGVDILWFMPIHPIGLVKRKGSLGSYYSIKDFKDVNPEYGSKADFKNLINAAHNAGMKVILDWVANHAAWDNVWTKTNPDFFERDDQGNFKPPYDWDDVIQINHHNPQEQQAMIDAMKYWVTDFNIDGFRADLAHLTPLPFWINARTQISTLKDDLIWLAETEEINYHQAFDISFSWKWMHDTEDYCKGKKGFDELIKTLEHYKKDFPAKAMRMYFTSNHDENSWNGTEYEKYDGYVKALAVFSCTWQGIPLIYTGQELPVKKRLQFFDKDAIDWNKGIELHSFYKTLLELRKSNPAIYCGMDCFPEFITGAAEKNMIAFFRRKDQDALLVFINFDKQEQSFNYLLSGLEGQYKNVFTGLSVQLNDAGTGVLQPGEYLVFEKQS